MSEPKTKRISDLDAEEDMIQTTVLLPTKHFKKLDGLSSLKEMSKGAIVREALGDYFEKQNKIIKTPEGSKISNKVIKDLLRECRTYYGNFQVEGEKGFIVLCKEKGVKLNDLTDAQFEIVADKLKIGYEGYVVKPSVDEFIGKLSVLEPTEKQKDLLREKLGGGGGHGGEGGTWKCGWCGDENPSDVEECQGCLTPREETEEGEEEETWQNQRDQNTALTVVNCYPKFKRKLPQPINLMIHAKVVEKPSLP